MHGSAGNTEGLGHAGLFHNDWVQASDYENTGFLEFEVVDSQKAVVRFLRVGDGQFVDEGVIERGAASRQAHR